MPTPNTFLNWPIRPAIKKQYIQPYSYISEYEKNLRYYFRDYDDQYQLNAYQQFESIPQPLQIPK
jgi:hypothetical protein